MAAVVARALSRRVSVISRRSAPALRTSMIARSAVAVRPAVRTLSTSTDMFCYQCEQTDGGTGCTTVGVCGKDPQTAAMQDTLVYTAKSLAMWAKAAREAGVSEEALKAANEFTLEALFSTLTNVNFDAAAIHAYVLRGLALRDEVRALAEAAGGGKDIPADSAAYWAPADTSAEALEAEGKVSLGVMGRRAKYGDTVAGVQEMIMYGLKGTCAYAEHALRLGHADPEVYAGVHEALDTIGRGETDIGALVGATLGVGGTNLKVMAMLDGAHTGRFGAPEITQINHAQTEGPAILVSGHDMADIEELLKQTEGTGVNVYTHGEMMPAHTYPGLKKYKHLVGHYGGPWQLQKFDYAKFKGPIVQTTNCLMEPRKGYKDRLFTAGATGWPGVKHIDGTDFGPVIEMAKGMEGFSKTQEPKYYLAGFGHNTVMSVADQVIEAATKGDLKRIVLIGGCDGSESERSYYTELAMGLPQESLILTLGCGKYRLLGKKDYGMLPGTEIPRLLDMGQCNDSYSAIAVAVELAKALDTDVNGLPLSIVLSWFEQKAVAVLLTLLHLGVKDIRIGPALPAFVTPDVLNLLVENFNLQAIDTSTVNVEEVMTS